MKNEIQLTDPSRELWQLAQRLREHNYGNNDESKQASEAIAAVIGVDRDDLEFLDIIAAIGLRVERLIEFAQQVKDSEVDDELRNDLVSAARTFGSVFLPHNMHVNWRQAKLRFVQEGHLSTLRWFSQTARRHRPLRVISREDLENAQRNVSNLIAEIAAEEDAHWSHAPLADGLRRLQRVLAYLPFFGHEEAIEQIVILAQRASAIQEEVKEQTSAQDGSWAALRVLGLVALVGTLFCLPDQVATAITRYRGWGLDQAVKLVLRYEKPRLLPAPTEPMPEPGKQALPANERRNEDVEKLSK